jgi:hypothetical protein
MIAMIVPDGPITRKPRDAPAIARPNRNVLAHAQRNGERDSEQDPTARIDRPERGLESEKTGNAPLSSA